MLSSLLSCHVLILILLTFKSNYIGKYFEPYVESLQEEWISLLFPSKTTIFSISDAIHHIHHVLANYYQLPEKALATCHVASLKHPNWPLLRINEKPDWPLIGRNPPWPSGLALNASLVESRAFFEALHQMTLVLDIQTKHILPLHWQVNIVYDFHSQAQLTVSLAYQTIKQNIQSHNDSIPFRLCLLCITILYQCLLVQDFVRQEKKEQDVITPLLDNAAAESGIGRMRMWFGLISASNLLACVCAVKTYHYHLQLVYNSTYSFLFATTSALQWIGVIRYFESNPRYQVLARILERGIPDVLSFLIGVCPIFIAYVIFGTICFGSQASHFQTLGTTATTLFAMVNGDEITATFHDLAQSYYLGQLYVYSYIIFFTYIVLMVCIGIIENAFFSLVWQTT